MTAKLPDFPRSLARSLALSFFLLTSFLSSFASTEPNWIEQTKLGFMYGAISVTARR